MSNQEMQFADPDWKPTRPLQKEGDAQGQEEYRPQPINDDMRERARGQPAAPSAQQQGRYTGLPPYAGEALPRPQPMPARPYQQPQYRRRGRTPWFWIILAFILFGFLGGGFGSFGAMGQRDVVDSPRTFTVTTTPTIVINDPNGNIHIHRGDSNTSVSITTTRESGFFNDPGDIHVRINQAPDGTITGNVDSGPGFMGSSRVDFDVSVPQNATLQLNTQSGDVSVDSVDGQVKLSTESGTIKATHDTLSDGSTLATSSGGIDLSQDTLNGQEGITTSSGDVRVEQVSLAGQTTFSTSSGDIRFNGTIDPQGTGRFQTSSGGIDVTLPATSNFHLDASTSSGRIDSGDFPGMHVQKTDSGENVSGDVGTGSQKAMLTLQTNSGDINLRQAS